MSVILLPDNVVLSEDNYEPEYLSNKLDGLIHINLVNKLNKCVDSGEDIYVWTNDYHCHNGVCIYFGGFNKNEQLMIYKSGLDYDMG